MTCRQTCENGPHESERRHEHVRSMRRRRRAGQGWAGTAAAAERLRVLPQIVPPHAVRGRSRAGGMGAARHAGPMTSKTMRVGTEGDAATSCGHTPRHSLSASGWTEAATNRCGRALPHSPAHILERVRAPAMAAREGANRCGDAGARPITHLRRDWARRCHICAGTGAHATHVGSMICIGTGVSPEPRDGERSAQSACGVHAQAVG